ncbi:hypothetical protein [Piscinibacter gummiphilus]|uniref:Uncharacterized protein n=1 Tax=Piscinibacter gummiphilus TaxID=946333 RepID=A0A1W6L557_9BURK|nr:hypothetical protein [Piscinibacter gummiphilus]ARN19336.1 hypothetical protein A4W93_05105 [Piscinibacter gummiphilus]ATU64003.1 hypothetical protein CPZ87_05190 [Piscinibacter gummiphilus]GLS93037.1 hypothetical protein GCM10007918_03280 [Piscinibacter gummiphilus]
MATDRALEVLKARAGLELGDAARAFADAARLHADRGESARRIEQACSASRAELQRLAGGGPINLATYDLVRRIGQADRQRLRDARAELSDAEASLERARLDVARLRLQERGLGQAIDRLRRAARDEDEARAQATLDDLWLQQTWRLG